MKGSYALLLELDEDSNLRVGALGDVDFLGGHYIYLGSAMNGIEGRVRRHLRDEKKMHWHIDYLLKKAKIKEVYQLGSERKLECEIAEGFSRRFEVAQGFGSSDCKCKGHLFYGGKKELVEYVKERGFERFNSK